MTVQEIRIKLMKNHIGLDSISRRLKLPPVIVNKMLDNEDLSEEEKEHINATIDEMLKTWRRGIVAEQSEKSKLLRKNIVEKYKREKAKLGEKNGS